MQQEGSLVHAIVTNTIIKHVQLNEEALTFNNFYRLALSNVQSFNFDHLRIKSSMVPILSVLQLLQLQS